jgi:hypothetical protein
MIETTLMQDRISGLTAKLTELRTASDLFKKAQGLHEEAEKAGKEAGEAEARLQTSKTKLAELRAQKHQALQSTVEALSKKMSEVLPEGEAAIKIGEDGDVWIGWKRPDGRRVPWAGLSGGERIIFDAALSCALLGDKGGVLVLEAAEADPIRLQKMLTALARNTPASVQVILNTWSAPANVPEAWRVETIQ